MKACSALVLSLSAALSATPVLQAQRPASEITLERIMADQDWVARSPSGAYWADDSTSIYWSQKRLGSDQRDLIQTDLEGRELRRVSDAELPFVDVTGGDWSDDRQSKVYSRGGDLFLKMFSGPRAGQVLQLTRTSAGESAPFFLVGDQQIAFRRGGTWLIRDSQFGAETEVAILRGGEDPDADDEETSNYLEEQNLRLSKYLALQQQRREEGEVAADARRAADTTAAPTPFYLGSGMNPRGSTLSPDGKWMAVTYGSSSQSGKSDSMPIWVTESSYVEPRNVRSLVGTGKPATTRMALLDLDNHRMVNVDLETLPGITDQPLAAIIAASKSKNDAGSTAEAAAPANQNADAKPRPISVGGITFSEDGSRVAFQARSADNKDRWIATVSVADARSQAGNGEGDEALQPAVVERRTDEAWIGRISGGMGWVDGSTLWFQSEATGYSHLYLHDAAAGITKQMTSGDFEVTNVAADRSNRYLYFRANQDHPGVTEIHRLEVASGDIEQITSLGGMNTAVLSPDGEQLLITHSEIMRPAELYVQPARPGAEARKLTETVTEDFTSLPWIQPTVIEVPNENGDPIYSRLYLPPGAQPGETRPAVLFIHGAGYLQNAHQGWSNYSREFMFHSLLAHKGFVVLDMDYRASAGYGRDWRTAIYRQMGTPELADLVSGVGYLVENHDVDPERIGCYGGSYGGFMTLMALFNAPTVFKAGAALRPVTDWAHYNHGYTSNILNTPEDDPEAYEISSPIEYAEGLQGHLLICHGMLDNNVFFQDTVRLVQRLIELEKENWETAVYPIEAHGFRQPSSWLDEYRRILKLFEAQLR